MAPGGCSVRVMSTVHDENYEQEDDLISDDDTTLYRARKRRRLDDLEIHHTDNDSPHESDKSDHVPNQSLNRTQCKDKLDTLLDSPKPWPKSKHRIHIPKNPELPADGFYSQPPKPGSSSPYRIGQFYWQKPNRKSPSPSTRLSHPNALAPTPSNHDRIASGVSSSGSERLRPSTNSVDLEGARTFDNAVLLQHDTFPLDSQSPRNDRAMFQDYDDVLADLPSDAFSSPTASDSSTSKARSPVVFQQRDDENPLSRIAQHKGVAAPLVNLRQTTLFGQNALESASQSQPARRHNWPLANREEPPTHHKLDRSALQTWVYPTNLGTIREYQYSIVARGLYHNLLVALPTGLGKTFIAATIMLNFFRWTADAQIVFVAPTRPLVSQQVKACYDIVGIPSSATTMLNGGIAPGLRAEEWLNKRVFFMTPHTLINDLTTGICDPKRIVLLVVDEAHRATGGYSYVQVVKFLNRFNSSYRVLALTATPGASIEAVQEVIDSLGISRVEIRTEESIDLRQYVHSRKVETILFDYSEEMVMVMDLFSKAIQPVLSKLNGMNAYWAKDPMKLTAYGCTQARVKWMGSEAGKLANPGVKWMVNTIFSLLASLAHGIELLKFHGIGPFFHKVLGFQDGDDEKGGKYRKQIIDCDHFRTMMARIQLWINKSDFVGHPKLEYLQNVILRHFLDAGEGRGASDPSNTRIMVFAHYRDSADEITRVLKRNDPMIRPHVFVGQANSKDSKGMDQKLQLEIIKKFQGGIYNTLVATSIGEEGLDIGEVDLIICYDASASPIRMLQRMGRTGRKRAGKIIVTLMKEKEEENFSKAKDNYEKMQNEISAGTRFQFHDDQSRRIVPKEIQPAVDKKTIDIPPENTQAGLPEPKKRAKPPKRPAKKYHMPDGVRTGFVNASRIKDEGQTVNFVNPKPAVVPEPIPTLEEILLNDSESRELERNYLDVKGDVPQIVDTPRLDAFPRLQRSTRRTKYVGHGRATTRFVQMLGSMNDATKKADDWYELRLCSEDRLDGNIHARRRSEFSSKAVDSSTALGESNIDSSQTPNTGDKATPELRKSLPFYQPKKSYHSGSDSGDDLPDLGALVRTNGSTPAAMSTRISDSNSRWEVRSRKRSRRDIDDDSDE